MKTAKRKSACPSLGSILKFFGYCWMFFNVGAIHKVLAETNFPEDGTFKQQSDWVDNLPKGCSEESQSVVESIIDAENPFKEAESHSTHYGKSVKVWHHEFDQEYGVVSRRTVETAKVGTKSVTDTEEIMIGGESQDGTLQPVTFRFQRDKNGLLKPVAKTKNLVTEFAEGVEKAGKEGLVAKAEVETYNSGFPLKRTCFTTRLRDKQNK